MKGVLVILPPPRRALAPARPLKRAFARLPQMMRLLAPTPAWMPALILVAASLGSAACGDLGDEPTNGDVDTTVSFSAEVQPIFTAHCALADCHGEAGPQMGLSLAAGASYAEIVDQPSLEKPELRLVRPGEPDSSYLYLKIIDAPAIEGARMPSGGTLSDEDAQTIRRWIEQGALPDR